MDKETKALNLHQRINEVRRRNEYIRKTKEVDGKYKVVTHDQVTAALRDDLVKFGVIIAPTLVSGEVRDTAAMTKQYRLPLIRFEAVFDVAFINADNPADREILRIPAHALDTGDKAPGKALSYAVKSAMLKMFSIETGEDEEERKEAEVVEGSITVKQMEAFTAEIDALPPCDDLKERAHKLWEKIRDACNEANDHQSKLMLRARLSAKVDKLSNKNAPTQH